MLVTLSEINLKIHQYIYQLLAEGERAGVASLADVTQTQARLARAESILFLSRADLSRAVANYTRVVGIKPEELSYTSVPEAVPHSMEEALKRTENKNPELLAFNARLVEADAMESVQRGAG